MKNLLRFMLMILFWAGNFSYAQNKIGFDSTHSDSVMMEYTLDSIIVTDSRLDSLEKILLPGVRSFYFGDPQKELSFLPGVTSVAPFMLAEMNVDNLPSQFTGMYYGRDMLIPILGNKSVFQGAASLVHPGFFSLELEADGYSSSYGDIGGIRRMVPKPFTKSISGKISSDFVDRHFFVSGKAKFLGLDGKSRLSFRHVGVVQPIVEMVPELEILPQVVDLEGFFELSDDKNSLELYHLNTVQFQAFENGRYFGLEENIRQDVRHNLSVAIFRRKLGDVLLKFAGSYEYEGQDSKIFLGDFLREKNEFITNISFNLEASNLSNSSRLGFAFYNLRSLREGNNLRNIYRLYSEKSFILGDFVFFPSGALSYYEGYVGHSEAIKISYFMKKNEINFAFGNYETFLFDNSSFIGRVTSSKNFKNPDVGIHSSLEIRLRKVSFLLLDYFDFSLFAKFIKAEFSREGYVKGYSKGIRMILKNNLTNSVLTGYLASSKINRHGVAGTIDYDLNYSFSLPLSRVFTLNSQISLRDGIWGRDHSTGKYSRFNSAFFLNIGLMSGFNLFGAEVEAVLNLFNILGKSPELIRYESGESLISKKAPTWGNISISIEY